MGMMRRPLPSGYPSIMRGRMRPRFVVPSWSSLLPALVVAVAYYIPARLSLRFIVSVSGVSAIWPATGIGVAGLLLFGPEAWPGILLGQFAVDVANGLLPMHALAIAAGQALAALCAVTLLAQRRFDHRMARTSDIGALIGAAALAGVIAASVGTSVLASARFLHHTGWILPWFTWWVSEAMAIVVVTPLVLVVSNAVRDRKSFSAHRGELLLIAVTVALASRMLFGNTLPLVFLVFPFVLWAALRLGPPGVALVNIVVAWTAVSATVNGNGAFATLPSQLRLVSLQSFIASVSVTGLVLGAVTAAWRWALDDVRDSRARLVEAGDVERRRVERNLHDGAQQRLVALSFRLGLAQAKLGPDADPAVRRGIEQASEELGQALSELRELAQGIHPAILTENGLRTAVESLGERMPVPVQAAVTRVRYPSIVEVTAYFVVTEALANAVKHAQASVVYVDIRERRGSLLVEVRDDGRGGAELKGGSGMVGLADRVAAVGGVFEVESPAGAGTRVRARIPCR